MKFASLLLAIASLGAMASTRVKLGPQRPLLASSAPHRHAARSRTGALRIRRAAANAKNRRRQKAAKRRSSR